MKICVAAAYGLQIPPKPPQELLFISLGGPYLGLGFAGGKPLKMGLPLRSDHRKFSGLREPRVFPSPQNEKA